MVMILVNLDLSKGLTERMDVEVGDWEYTQLMEYDQGYEKLNNPLLANPLL